MKQDFGEDKNEARKDMYYSAGALWAFATNEETNLSFSQIDIFAIFFFFTFDLPLFRNYLSDWTRTFTGYSQIYWQQIIHYFAMLKN